MRDRFSTRSFNYACLICELALDHSDEVTSHFAHHCMSGKVWCCRGVPREDAAYYGLTPYAPSYTFLGRERVGGCMRVFLKRYQLAKHLAQRFNTCESVIVGRKVERQWEDVGVPISLLQ
ncbi:hypothetical protein C8J57DRAFT_1417658 [Mycena rebaudengoi]|nr:hypothetical protein C8J57DRAFT_1417658 [Mycena rebaudengoi]